MLLANNKKFRVKKKNIKFVNLFELHLGCFESSSDTINLNKIDLVKSTKVNWIGYANVEILDDPVYSSKNNGSLIEIYKSKCGNLFFCCIDSILKCIVMYKKDMDTFCVLDSFFCSDISPNKELIKYFNENFEDISNKYIEMCFKEIDKFKEFFVIDSINFSIFS